MTNNQQATKKMLTAFEVNNPEKASSDFLVPVIEEDRFVLFGTKSKRISSLGRVVFVGREITVNDVFARLVDSGRKVPVVADTLSSIGNYIDQLNGLKIGQVVEIVEDVENECFKLEPVTVPRPANKSSLP